MMESFKFVTVAHPDEVKAKEQQHVIRTHAIRNTARKARNKAVTRKENFIIVDLDPKTHRPIRQKKGEQRATLTRSPSATLVDPFSCLPASPERLRVLMRHGAARQAGEPIFCVEEVGRIFFQGIDTVFHGALTDPALFHALSLTLALAANDDKPNVECLTHRGEVLKHLGNEVNDSSRVGVSTISAMLMLVGYEYRVDSDNKGAIALHIRALDTITRHSRADAQFSTGALSRALFWQDLMSSVIAGTDRFLSHGSFPEIFWSQPRCPLYPFYCHLRIGFQEIASHFHPEMIAVLEDLNALCMMLDAKCSGEDLPIARMEIDNGQAWIESRLADLLSELRRSGEENAVYKVCIFATYLCTYKLSTSIWEGLLIPEFCAMQILRILQTPANDHLWDAFPELVVWLLFAGGAFAVKRRTKVTFAAFILGAHENRIGRFHREWETLRETLTRFVWSAHAMEPKYRQFWGALHSENFSFISAS
ncbi:hypothetical protein BDV96DRAFT_164542 [Lophiotrema nucula]|uniref:Uncharacterized protein n=1 Tax=Lophiotrema nucula TaxID=690887 RepID=A0A6A5YYL8_9PLEO|nr:hypothetical protein BDV96DRAFT_164542 [Lophiotrema nucula]